MYSAQYIGFIDFPFDCTQVPRRLTPNVIWHSIASWFPEIIQKRLFLSNDNTQYQVTRLNKQLWVTGLTLMTTETYASFFMCIINIHLDVHFLYYNCYGNCYSFFSKLSMLTDLTITVSIVPFLNSALTLSVCHLGFHWIFNIASISSSIASNIH